MASDKHRPMEEVIRADGRYPLEAYKFLHEGWKLAVREVHGEAPEHSQRHVHGAQICDALRSIALDRWGMLARTVLETWNIHETLDFGNMVYLLIENGDFRKQDADSIEDFRDVYDFGEAFDVPEKFEVEA